MKTAVLYLIHIKYMHMRISIQKQNAADVKAESMCVCDL